jgi:hypothetical protein
VQRVAVSQTGRIKPLAIVIDTTCSVDNFVPAVAVNIAHAQRMVSLASIFTIPRRAVVAVKGPDVIQSTVAPIPG